MKRLGPVGISLLLTVAALGITTYASGHLQGRIIYNEDGIAQRYVVSQKQLQESYDRLSNIVEPKARKKLAHSQTTWRRFQVAECDFLSQYSPADPLHPKEYTECLTDMNRQRTADLQYQLQWHQLLNPFADT